MNYFPINLNITNRLCIVVGGGRVAERKVKGLLECGGQVVVISPELTRELATLQKNDQISWKSRDYLQGDLDHAFMVIAATDNEKTQAEVFADAEKKGLLVNVADVPERCNFILPATMNHNDLAISVSTAGKSPALARMIRKKLENDIGPEYGILADILGMLRPVVLSRGRSHEQNKVVFNDILDERFPLWIQNSDWHMVREHLVSVLGNDINPECLNRIKNMLKYEG